MLHLSGITRHRSPTALETVHRAFDVAQGSGTLVSFDVNHRTAVLSDDTAVPILAYLCRSADLPFAGTSEAKVVLGAEATDDDETVARGLAKLGQARMTSCPQPKSSRRR